MSRELLEEVARLADRLSPEEKRSLVTYLNSQPEHRATAAITSPSLWGIWRDQFPEDFDLDAALDEIRGEWKKEWPQVFDR